MTVSTRRATTTTRAALVAFWLLVTQLTTQTTAFVVMTPSSPSFITALSMATSSSSVPDTTSMNDNYENDDDDLPRAYKLPQPRDTSLNKLEQEFRDMMQDFSVYTERDISLVRNPRLHAIYRGIAAGGSEHEVYRAFEVLFEDYIPIRIAGRMIYGKLKTVMEQVLEETEQQHDAIASSTGLSRLEIENSRRAFLVLADNVKDVEATLTVQQLADTGIAEMAVELMGYADFEEFLKKLDQDQTGQFDFEKLMIGLQRCAKDSSALECTVGSVLPEIAKRMEPQLLEEASESRDLRHKKYSDRYDAMVESFIEWEDYVPEGEGRRLDVLRGCFVGARNEAVVEALRIVYMDYSALRVAGDLIFKLMAKIVKAARKKAST